MVVKSVIGLMSGTSLDGLDLCCVTFKYDEGKWEYQIVKAEDEPYPDDIKQKLANAQNMSAEEYALFHSDYGIYLGQRVKAFIDRNGLKPDLIASHGHTIFHQPGIRFTAQIGSGAGIAAETEVDCVCDFRTTDVALFGQGAPLVPIGDRTLFADYDYCLNMGGFSNISFNEGDVRSAYDISPVNYVMNHYTRTIGLDYDKDGEMARSGKVCEELLERLDNLEFYSMKGPKSLGREWVENEVIPLIDSYNLSIEDKLCTFCEHVAVQIGSHIKGGKVLLTGGGALNKYLVERMSARAPQCEYVVPDKLTINFKEALIFAFLGMLYICDMPNCLSSVTGAKFNCVGGALYKGRKR
ncbi:MAG: anhydro-N-acetylmuramic acid kinase [Bacteroidales bacterium]|nr:anhydro-N-acetylmuramic acid kinase [Bacteroidales bacterium]MBQ2243669.1 anhydro-N-acetylmuramic acid kinase [Bacteroidales bacterium]